MRLVTAHSDVMRSRAFLVGGMAVLAVALGSFAAFAQSAVITTWGSVELAAISPTLHQADGVVSSVVDGLFRTYSCPECATFASDSGSNYAAINPATGTQPGATVTFTFVDPVSGNPQTASNVSAYIADGESGSAVKVFDGGVEVAGCANVFVGCPYAFVRSPGKSVEVMFPGPISQIQFIDDGDGHVIDDLSFDLNLNPQTKAECKNGGWEQYGFKNQGQCIRFVNTGKDSR